MPKFVLTKDGHRVTTIDAIEKVNLLARGYVLVKPEPVKAPTPKPKSKAVTEPETENDK